MQRTDIKESICEIGRRLYARELISAGEGNISFRRSDKEIWTTPTGVCKGFMTADILVRVDLEGNIIGEGKPSSELKMHLAVYRELPHINAVVHAHPVYSSVHAVSGKAMDKFYLTESIITLGKVPVAPYATPATEEVAESVKPFLKSNKALLLANHGALTWADDLEKAYFLMESLESAAKILFFTELAGKGAEIPSDKVDKLRKALGM